MIERAIACLICGLSCSIFARCSSHSNWRSSSYVGITWHRVGVYSPDNSSCTACGIAKNSQIPSRTSHSFESSALLAISLCSFLLRNNAIAYQAMRYNKNCQNHQKITGYRSSAHSTIRNIDDHCVSTSQSHWSKGSSIVAPLSSLLNSLSLLASTIVAWRSSWHWPLAWQLGTGFWHQTIGLASRAQLYVQSVLKFSLKLSADVPSLSSSSSVEQCRISDRDQTERAAV